MNSLTVANKNKFRYEPEMSSIAMLEVAARSGNDSLVEQVIDEEATRFAEILDGPIRTDFEFQTTESGLVSRGGSNLLDLWKNSYELTKNKARHDVRQKDLLAIRRAEYNEGLAVEELSNTGQNGDGFLVISAYPEELEHKFGKEFVNQEGFNSRRRLAFIRQYRKQGDSIVLTTASVDNSDFRLWSKITGENITSSEQLLNLRFNCNSGNLDVLLGEYDNLLNSRTNLRHLQGRTNASALETYIFVKNQNDLLEYNLNNLHSIASSNISHEDKLNQKIQLTKQVASALVYRYENKVSLNNMPLEIEINSASARAKNEGLEFISCGGYLALSEESTLRMVTRASDSMKCVTCPFCKKTVDAIVKNSVIACPECKVQVNTKTNKITENQKPKISFTKILEQILEDLFTTRKN